MTKKHQTPFRVFLDGVQVWRLPVPGGAPVSGFVQAMAIADRTLPLGEITVRGGSGSLVLPKSRRRAP